MKPTCIVKSISAIAIIAAALSLSSCEFSYDNQSMTPIDRASSPRSDGAVLVNISGLPGAFQNPAWSPDGTKLAFSNWRTSYNEGACYIYSVTINSPSTKTLLAGSGSSTNVNMPGGATIWNPSSNQIIFCSTANSSNDQAAYVSGNGGSVTYIPNQSGYMAWEPGWSPDGLWIVYERVKGSAHAIYKCKKDGSSRTSLGTSGDCRQPSWSPANNLICYQKKSSGAWNVWVCKPDGTGHRKLTSGTEATDCSFSPDGRYIVFSAEGSGTEYANIWICLTSTGVHPQSQWIRITNDPGYDGAPGWSQDGTKIAFEHTTGDPDSSATSTIWTIAVPIIP